MLVKLNIKLSLTTSITPSSITSSQHTVPDGIHHHDYERSVVSPVIAERQARELTTAI